MLVFTQFVAVRRAVAGPLDAPRDRDAVPPRGRRQCAAATRWSTAFQAGEAPVLLLSLKAGGVGLNLTRATHVVHYDRWWNPAVEDQATDRHTGSGRTGRCRCTG